MIPLLADRKEIPSDTTTLRHYMVGSMATTTQFHRAASVYAMPEAVVSPMAHFCPRLYPVNRLPKSLAVQKDFEMAGPQPGVFDESARHVPAGGRWLIAVVDRLIELGELPPNWDHHGAPPVAEGDINLALQVLAAIMGSNTPAPAIVPISGGGLQIEWHRASLDVEIVVGLGDEDGLYFCDVATGLEWEGPTIAGFAEHDLAKRLIG